MCPYYLDGDQIGSADPVIPVVLLHCAVFKVRDEASPRRDGRTCAGSPPKGGLSKLDSMRRALR